MTEPQSEYLVGAKAELDRINVVLRLHTALSECQERERRLLEVTQGAYERIDAAYLEATHGKTANAEFIDMKVAEARSQLSIALLAAQPPSERGA